MKLVQSIKRVICRINALRLDKATQAFIDHNKKIFHTSKNESKKVLFELNEQHSSHVAYSYLAEVLSRKYDAEVIAYTPEITSSLKAWIKHLFLFYSPVFRVYRSFGACKLLLPGLDSMQKEKVHVLFNKVLSAINTKRDIETLSIDGVWLGDLIYDSYLRHYKKPTVDKSSPDFQASLKHSIALYVFWSDYIADNDVKAVSVSHCVYFQAIPLRVGVAKGIPVYQINATHAYRLNTQNLFAYNDFVNYPQRFSKLAAEVQEAGLKTAEARINRRLAGEIGVDMEYSTKSAYGDFKKERLLKESSRKKILIATHCFFDSPHSYGNNLFPDFYEWLDFLGRMTEKTDYDWYIKTHPDYLPGTKEIIDSFIGKYPKFNCLPADSSHHQLVAEGVDVALTVYGTIGFEYAAMGIPVINASLNNPHVAYNFNFHPRSIKEYEDLLLDLNSLKLNIERRQVLEYYFMKHIYNTQNWLFSDYNNLIRDLGGYGGQMTSHVYEKWLEEWTSIKHEQILQTLRIFVESGDFRLMPEHIVSIQ